MKMIRCVFIVIWGLVCFWGCARNGAAVGNGEAMLIPFANDEPQPVESGRFFSDITFVPLETNEKCLLSHIQRVELRDSLVFLQDNDQIFLFDDKGRFISQIGRKGRGPGEYIGFRGFFVDVDYETVSIIDPMKGSITNYGFDGRYRSSSEIPSGLFDWGYMGMPADQEKVLIFNSYNPGNNMAYTLLDQNNPEQVSYFCTYDPVRIPNYTYHFASHPMTRSGDNIHFTMPLDPLVYEYSDGNVSGKYHIETPAKIIPKDLMQETEGTYLSRLLDLTSKNYFGGFTDIFETDSLLFLHYMAKIAYPGLYVMDKTSHTGDFYLFPSTSEKLTSPVFPFSASDGSRIVSAVSLNEAMKLKDYIREHKIGEDKVSAGLLHSLNQMNEESNPMLVFYTAR